MNSRSEESRKATHEPKKVKDTEKDESVELEVQELEERIAPAKTFNV